MLRTLELLESEITDYIDDYVSMESDFSKLIDAIENITDYGLLAEIRKAAYNIAVELGEPIPNLWRFSDNRILSTLKELEDKAEEQCQVLRAAIS